MTHAGLLLKALEQYDFGDNVVGEMSGWEYEEPGVEFTRALFFGNSNDPDGDTMKGHFTVVFEDAKSAKVRDAYAMIDGNLVGELAIYSQPER